MKSVVATGRRIKVREGLIPAPKNLVSRSRRGVAAVTLVVAAARHDDLACRGELVTPSTTTTSPSSTPLVISTRSPLDRADLTGFIVTVESFGALFIRCANKRLLRSVLVRRDGTMTTLFISSSSFAFTNWLEKSVLSLLSNWARNLSVPVAGSIWLSVVSSVPSASLFFCVRSSASTGASGPP